MPRKPTERMAWEGARAIVSEAKSLQRLGGQCIDPAERARMFRRERELTLLALEMAIDIHQAPYRQPATSKSSQLKLVA